MSEAHDPMSAMRMPPALVLSTAVLLVSATLSAAAPARAADLPRTVVVVIDGSGSMWGKIEGDKSSKLVATREALRRLLPTLPQELAVGLTSFGHRRKGDCSDAETLVEPVPRDADRIMASLDKLNPKGKGPLALALREAATEFTDGRRGAIVLVHDNADNCQQDACAAAAEIAKAQPGLAIHTVGLALEPEEARKTQCIAAATGGKAFDARTAAEADAAIGEALQLAGLDTVKPRGPATAPPPPSVAKAEPPAKPASPPAVALAVPGIDATAVLAAGGTPVSVPVRWRILQSDGGATLAETVAARLTRPFASGSYVVEARLGLAEARVKVDVTDKAAVAVIALDAGVVTPAARAYKDGGIQPDVTYAIRPVKPAAGAQAGGMVWIGKSGGSDVVLPAGTYVVRAEQGAVAKEETVTLAAGSRKAVDLVLGTGRLDVTASLDEDGAPLDRVMFVVSEDDPDAPQGKREVTRSAAPSASFIMPAGTYYVTVRASGAEARQRVAVGAGDVVKRQIALGVSRLSLSTRLDKASQATLPPLLTRVLPVDGEPAERGRSVTQDSEFLLWPGRYRIVAQAGLQNGRAERIVEVKAKEHAKVTIPIEAAHVVLKLGDGAPATLDQFWEVKDAAGQVVWRTTHSEARMTLAPGRYTTHLEWRGRRIERVFDVKTGEAKTIVFSAE